MINTNDFIGYDYDKHLYFITPLGFEEETGIDLVDTLEFLETEEDALIYCKNMSNQVKRFIQRYGPNYGSRHMQRKFVVEYLIFKDNADERNDFIEMVIEYIKHDIQGGAAGLQNETFLDNEMLDRKTKADIRFSVNFMEILNISVLGKKRYAIVIPSEEFRVGY